MTHNTRMKLKTLYSELYGVESHLSQWDDLGRLLARAYGRPRAWSGKYIRSITNGDKGFQRISPAIQSAVNTLHKNVSNSPNETDRKNIMAIAPYEVLARYNIPPGTIITGRARRCGWCGAYFIPPYDSQKYCQPSCKRKAKNLRRRERKLS